MDSAEPTDQGDMVGEWLAELTKPTLSSSRFTPDPGPPS
jgi:hypothetical protein